MLKPKVEIVGRKLRSSKLQCPRTPSRGAYRWSGRGNKIYFRGMNVPSSLNHFAERWALNEFDSARVAALAVRSFESELMGGCDHLSQARGRVFRWSRRYGLKSMAPGHQLGVCFRGL